MRLLVRCNAESFDHPFSGAPPQTTTLQKTVKQSAIGTNISPLNVVQRALQA